MMASTLSLHKDQAATGRLNRKLTPTAPPAGIVGNDDGGSDSRMPSDDEQFLESLKAELLSKKRKREKIVLPPGFLAPKFRQCRQSAVEEQDGVVAPPRRDDSDGKSSPYGATDRIVLPAGFLAPKALVCRPSAVEEKEEVVAQPRTDEGNGNSSSAVQTVQITNSPKRRRSQNDEWKNNSSFSDNSLQPNIAEDSSQLNLAEITLQKDRHCDNNPVNPESVEPAKKFQSSLEFPSFSISMKQSHVSRSGRQLTLPKKFCKRHLPNKNTTIILKGENGVEYETMYLSRTEHGSNLSAGWAVFCEDHKLAVGDVVRFQLVNQTKFEVSVVKSNRSENVAEHEDAILEKPRRRSLKKRNRRPRGAPSTPRVVCIDELTQRLVEAEAARLADKEAMQKKYDSIINDMQKKYDSIMAAMPKNSPRVQAPDTVVPDDVDSDETHQVTNLRKRRRVNKVSTLTGDPTTSKDGSSCEDSLQLTIAEIRLQKDRHCNSPPNPGSLERTKNIQSSSEFPSFLISMKPSYVSGSSGNLRLPTEFCKQHLPDKDTTIILKGENGVEYKTTYLTYADRHSCLSAGWRVFWKDHKLAVGDVLRFQLVNQTKFEVFIVKSNQFDEVDEALFLKQSASGAKKKLVPSDRAEKQKMKLEAKLKEISKARDWLNGEAKKLDKMHESVCHKLKLLKRRGD